jgi:hypothetical protein
MIDMFYGAALSLKQLGNLEQVSAREIMTFLCIVSHFLSYLQFATNSMSICDEFMVNIGAAAYHELSMFNHSCLPNCVLSFVGSTIYIKTICDIEKGEELTISYIDVSEPRAMRRKTLRERYFFTCTCPLCQQEVKYFSIHMCRVSILDVP